MMAADEPKTAEEMRARYAAIRERLGIKPKAVTDPEEIRIRVKNDPKPAVNTKRPRPEPAAKPEPGAASRQPNGRYHRLMWEKRKKDPRIWALMDRIGRKHGVSREDIMGPARAAYIVAARHEVMALLEAEVGMSMRDIARLLKRNKSTVKAGIDQFRDGKVYQVRDLTAAQEGALYVIAGDVPAPPGTVEELPGDHVGELVAMGLVRSSLDRTLTEAGEEHMRRHRILWADVIKKQRIRRSKKNGD